MLRVFGRFALLRAPSLRSEFRGRKLRPTLPRSRERGEVRAGFAKRIAARSRRVESFRGNRTIVPVRYGKPVAGTFASRRFGDGEGERAREREKFVDAERVMHSGRPRIRGPIDYRARLDAGNPVCQRGQRGKIIAKYWPISFILGRKVSKMQRYICMKGIFAIFEAETPFYS